MPRTRTGTGQTHKTTNWTFRSKPVILKSPLASHCLMQRAAQPQHRHTFSFEVTPAFRQQGYCFLKADVKLIWCPNSSPIFPVHVWTYQEEGFGTRQPCWGCAWPSYLQTSLGAPGGGTMLSELPAPSQEGGQKLPSLDCMCWQFKFWLSGSAQRTRAGSRLQGSSSRGRSRGHARSPLTPPKRKNSAHGLFLSQAGFLG